MTANTEIAGLGRMLMRPTPANGLEEFGPIRSLFMLCRFGAAEGLESGERM